MSYSHHVETPLRTRGSIFSFASETPAGLMKYTSFRLPLASTLSVCNTTAGGAFSVTAVATNCLNPAYFIAAVDAYCDQVGAIAGDDEPGGVGTLDEACHWSSAW